MSPSQAQDWSRLTHLSQGSLIEVHSVGAPPGLDDRCRLEAVGIATLSCTWEADRSTRLIFPAAQVAAVFQVRPPGLRASTWVLFAGIGVGLAALATGNLAFIGIAAVIECAVILASGPAPPPRERLSLVYLR